MTHFTDLQFSQRIDHARLVVSPGMRKACLLWRELNERLDIGKLRHTEDKYLFEQKPLVKSQAGKALMSSPGQTGF